MASTKKNAKTKTKAKKAPRPTATETLLFHGMYLMAVIDGSASEAELQVVEGLLGSLPEFGSTSVEALVAGSRALVSEHGGTIESLIALTDLRKKPHRVKCFLLAAEVAYASGGIGKAEAALLRTIAKVLGVDAATTKMIVKVLGMKYVA
jgi:tellurite resistance protein